MLKRDSSQNVRVGVLTVRPMACACLCWLLGLKSVRVPHSWSACAAPRAPAASLQHLHAWVLGSGLSHSD